MGLSPQRLPPRSAEQARQGIKNIHHSPAAETELVEVLRFAKMPMNTREIVETAIELKLWQPTGAKTPEQTLYGAIVSENKTKEHLRIVKSDIKGKFADTDGNIFCVIAKVRAALRQNERSDLIKEFTDYITSSSSYEETLCRVMEYVIVK